MAESFTHIVKKGDTLARIVQKYTGLDPVKSEALAVSAAREIGLPVYDLSSWTQRFGTTAERVCNSIRSSARKFSGACEKIRFIELQPGQVIEGNFDSGENRLDLQISPPRTPAMEQTIDLRRLKDRGLPQEFEFEVIGLDFDHNDSLQQTDLERQFGKTATRKLYGDLIAAIQKKNIGGFRAAISQMESIRNETIARRFHEAVMPLAEELKRYGIDPNQPFNLRDTDPIAQDKEQYRRTVTRLLSDPFSRIYKEEFGDVPDPQKIAEGMGSVMLFDEIKNMYELGRRTIGDPVGAYRWWPQYHRAREQESYFKYQYNEYRQPSYITEIEQRFSLDIRTEGPILSGEQAAILAEVLQFIRDRRPQDLSLLKLLELSNDTDRGMAYVGNSGGQIFIDGPFAPPPIEEGSIPGHYAVESQESFQRNPSRDYLIQKLTHELGHLVEHRDGRRVGGFDVPTEYELMAPQHAHEWFAEDYSIFLQSGGQKVMRRTVDGTEVPNYDRRLSYFSANYPVK